jgi:hypothetical protein
LSSPSTCVVFTLIVYTHNMIVGQAPGPNDEERVAPREPHTPTFTTPDGRWLWDGDAWVEARQSWPASVRRARLSWFASITALWLLAWLHPWWSMFTPSFAVFAAACAATVAFGGVLARRGQEGLIWRAAIGGVLVLGGASIVAFGVAAAISGGGIGGFFGVILAVMVFGSIVIVALGTIGFGLLVLLLKVGARLSARPRRGR